MKTLYININNETIQSNNELKVLDYDLDSDFFFYLSEKIAKDCNIENENALITDFNTQDSKEDYLKIISQWNELKIILFSNKFNDDFEFTLPTGYIHWLKLHPQYCTVYDKNFSHGESAVISINLEELYEDSVKCLQRMILRKLYRENFSVEIDKIVFNDDAVTCSSSIIRTIKKMYEGVEFKAYRMWSPENEEKLHTTLQICEKCKEQICKDESMNMDKDDNVVELLTCPYCGSDDVENYGPDICYPYECNVCGYVWRDDENDEEDYKDDVDNLGHQMSEYYESFDVVVRKSTKRDVQKQGGKLIDSKSGRYKMSNGIEFIFLDNSVVDSIYIGKDAIDSIPQFYKSLGLYWNIDKNCFRNIFENLGFDVCEKDDILFRICAIKYCAKFETKICIEITYFDEDMLSLRVW